MFMPVRHSLGAAGQTNLPIESHAMPARKHTPADAGALAAGLLVDACGPHAENSLRLEVLAGEDFSADSLVEAALAA